MLQSAPGGGFAHVSPVKDPYPRPAGPRYGGGRRQEAQRKPEQEGG